MNCLNHITNMTERTTLSLTSPFSSRHPFYCWNFKTLNIANCVSCLAFSQILIQRIKWKWHSEQIICFLQLLNKRKIWKMIIMGSRPKHSVIVSQLISILITIAILSLLRESLYCNCCLYVRQVHLNVLVNIALSQWSRITWIWGNALFICTLSAFESAC